MIRRTFLGATFALPFVGLGWVAQRKVLEGEYDLPTSIAEYPDVKVIHFHFSKNQLPMVEYWGADHCYSKKTSKIEWVYEWKYALIPTFCISAEGKVLNRKNNHKAAPLSHPMVQRELLENMRICAESARNSRSEPVNPTLKPVDTMILVTSDHPESRNGVGICIIEGREPHEVYKYGERPA